MEIWGLATCGHGLQRSSLLYWSYCPTWHCIATLRANIFFKIIRNRYQRRVVEKPVGTFRNGATYRGEQKRPN